MHDIAKAVKQAYDDVMTLYHDVVALHVKMTPMIQENSLSTSDLTDIGFFHREMENTFSELEQECRAQKELIGKIVAYRVLQDSLADPTLSATARGEYAIGTPEIVKQPILPSSKSPEYDEVMLKLGFSRDAIEHRLAKIHWVNLGQWLTRLAEEGKDVSFVKSKTVPTTVFRRRQ